MDTNSTDDTLNRMNKLASDTTQTLVDAAYLAQRQTADLVQAWLNTLDQTQQQQREIATRLVQQAQEAQTLLGQFVQDSARAGTQAFTSAAQTGADTATESMNRARQAGQGSQ